MAEPLLPYEGIIMDISRSHPLEYRNKAFISYRHVPRDIAVAELVQRKLEQFRVPGWLKGIGKRRRIGRIFRDETDFGSRSDLTDAIREELDDSEYLIVICSPDAGGKWVLEEIRYFLVHHAPEKILAVLSAGETEEVYPALFGQIEGAPQDPLPADFRRPRRQAVSVELPKITAALLGCEYDDLINRTRRQERQRLLVVLTAAFLLTAGIAVYYAVTSAKLRASYAAQRKSYLERLAEESRGLAVQSSAALKRGERLQAIRYALQGLPDEGNDRPVKGESVLALQDAVNAYIPEANAVSSELAEFIVDGSIFKWDAIESEGKIFLAATYNITEPGVCLWNVTDRKVIFDAKDQHTEEVSISMDFLLTSSALLFSNNGTMQALRLRDGALLWEEELENACTIRFLDASQQTIAMDVLYSLYESANDENDLDAEVDPHAEEEIQIRRLSDGFLERSLDTRILGEKRWEDSAVEEYAHARDKYTSVREGAFSRDGRKLALTCNVNFGDVLADGDDSKEEDSFSGEGEGGDKEGAVLSEEDLLSGDGEIGNEEESVFFREEERSSVPSSMDRLFLISVGDMDLSTLCEEQSIEAISMTESGHILALLNEIENTGTITMYGDGARASFTSNGKEVFLARSYSSQTGKMEWEAALEGGQYSGLNAAGDFFVPDFDGDVVLFTAGTHAEIRKADTGELLHKVEFPGLIVSASPGESHGEKALLAIAQDGSSYDYCYDDGAIIRKYSAYQALVNDAVRVGEYVLACSFEDSIYYRSSKISLYGKDAFDGSIRQGASTDDLAGYPRYNTAIYDTEGGNVILTEDYLQGAVCLDLQTAMPVWTADAWQQTDGIHRIGTLPAMGKIVAEGTFFGEDKEVDGPSPDAFGCIWETIDFSDGTVQPLDSPLERLFGPDGTMPFQGEDVGDVVWDLYFEDVYKTMNSVVAAGDSLYLPVWLLPGQLWGDPWEEVDETEKWEMYDSTGPDEDVAEDQSPEPEQDLLRRVYLARVWAEEDRTDGIDLTDILYEAIRQAVAEGETKGEAIVAADGESAEESLPEVIAGELSVFPSPDATQFLCYFNDAGTDLNVLLFVDWEKRNITSQYKDVPSLDWYSSEDNVCWSEDGTSVLVANSDGEGILYTKDGRMIDRVPEEELRVVGTGVMEDRLFYLTTKGDSLTLHIPSEDLLLDLPVSSEEFPEFSSEIRICNASVPEEGKLLFFFGFSHVFVVDIADRSIEASISDVVSYDRNTDMFLMMDADYTYCAVQRHSYQDLIETGKAVLRENSVEQE